MIINHNMASLNTYRQLSINNANSAKSLEKLSSGLRINKAGDDAAGLAISEKMRGQIRGLDQASRNAQDSISMIQTAEGSLSETHSILQRMKELATQSANDTNVGSDRTEIQKEINQLTSEINRIGNTTEFNTQKLLNGGTGKTGQVLYSVATAGVAEATPTGVASAISTVTGSVKAGTAAVSAVTTVAASTAGAAAVGVVSPLFTTTASGKAGTGETQLFRVETASVLEASTGTVGSPFATVTASSTGGTAAANKSEIVQGAAVGANTNTGTLNGGAQTTVAIQITTNFGVGNTIDIGGQTFTAVDSSKTALAAGEFKVGANADASAANLKLAIDANTTLSGVGVGKWSTAVVADTITLTSDQNDETAFGNKVVAGGAQANLATAAIGTNNAAYGIELKANFTEGDKITIAGFTLTAKSGGALAGEFNIGLDIEATRDAILASLDVAGGGGANQILSGGVTYNLSKSDPLWDASDDNNLIVLKNVATGVDANAAVMNSNTVTPLPTQKGAYEFEVATNFQAGQKLTIAGHEFTAATAGGNTSTQFQIGATFAETATALLAALTASQAGDPALNAYDITQGAAGSIYEDTLTFTEKVASGDAMAAPIVTNRAEVAGVYSFEVKEAYTVGDTIEIGGETLTGWAAASDATHFQVGADQAGSAAGIAAAVNANATLSARFTAAAGAGSFGNNKVTLTENGGEATGVDIAGPNTVKTAQTAGEYDFSVVKNFVAGEKITIAGQEFKATSGVAVAANGEFQVGGTTDLTTTSLKAALTATVGTRFTVGGAASNITLVEKAGQATGVDPTVGAVNGIGEVDGQYTLKLTTNASVGDKITISGRDFVGVSGAAAAGQFKVGDNIKDTTDNLIASITADATLGARYTASKVTDNTDPLNPVYSVNLLEDKVAANGVAVTATATQVTAVRGAYTFNVDTNFAAKDKIEIGGQTFTAKASGAVAANGEFNVGADETATSTSLIDAINANTTLKNHYVATSSGASIALVEKAGQESGEAVADPDVKGDSTAGVFNFATNAMVAGSKLTIDNTELTIATGGTEVQTAAELKTLVDANSTLNAKYNVAVSGANVTLTQKAGEESSTAPKLTYTTQAGSGFLAQMQIGANTGQSMTLDIKDMRSMALEVSSAAGAPGQTVTVDGKEYSVKWTATQSVTNGTDNVSQEFALDVSTHDNATAAVAMIQSAIEEVSAERSKLGAYTNRLEHTATNLGTSSENLTAAESRVRDVDMAKEMMQFQKNNILSQAAQAMLAQANQQPQGVLQLLR